MAAENSCQKYPLSIDDVQSIISEAISRGIFDKGMYDTYGILTSKGIQCRYLEMTKRRSRVDVEQRYLLIRIPEKVVNVYINGVNVNTNSKNVDNNSQSKVKESKVNKSKAEDMLQPPPEVQKVLDIYNANMPPITPIILDDIYSYLNDVEADVIIYAIQEAVNHDARTWNYVKRVVDAKIDAGHTTLAQVQEAKRNFKTQKEQPSSVYDDSKINYDELEEIMRGKM